MSIKGLRILPPFAIGRFGSSPTPLEAFDLAVSDDAPLAYRQIIPKETLEVDPDSGFVIRQYIPERIRFRDGHHIRPVAPFLEVFAQTADDVLEALTLDLLRAEGIGLDAVCWTVEVGNLKMFRRTGDAADKVIACVPKFNNHAIHELKGQCDNFLREKYIPFGTVRFVQPNAQFPEIRLRFTPAAGLVYGSSPTRFDPEKQCQVIDPVFEKEAKTRIVYDTERGKWRGFQDKQNDPTLTNPSDIYQGYSPDPNLSAISWGYLDDVCDGQVLVELTLSDSTVLKARAWISACMPAFAPDSQPIRTVADELEQLILGPEDDDDAVSIEDAIEIVRRALDTVRHMNTLVMNGNTVDGRANIAHTLGTQDTNDYGRQYAPIMASSLVDNFAVRTLHERIFAALSSGSAPWFAQALRRPEEIGDLSDKGRRKMPAMLRGADGRALALTRRQINKVVKAATCGIFQNSRGPTK
jgi:hypothetical protein